MIKPLCYICIFILFLSCDTDNGSDCFKSKGKEVTKSYVLDDFSRVIFREGVELQLIRGSENKIDISFGENLIDNVTTYIKDDRLYVENNTTCNHIRDVTAAKVVLSAKNITEIRNASQFGLYARDTLRFPFLTVISENFWEDEVNSGDVELLINNQIFSIVSNGISNFEIKGKTQNFNLNFAAGQGKFKGKQFQVQEIYVFHRGANTIELYPLKELKGEIRSIGDVVSYKRPPSIDVKEFYTGRLIFR